MRRGATLLPDYDHVVLDEAHTIEDVASDHFGVRITEYQVKYILNTLYKERSARGFLPTLGKKSQDDTRISRAISLVLAAMHAADDFFDSVVRYDKDHGRSNGRLEVPNFVKNPLTLALMQVATSLKILKDKVEDEADQFELGGFVGRLESMGNAITTLVEQNQTDSVYW